MSETLVIELGCANTASVLFALERLGAKARLSDKATEIAEAERVILPGVGAAGFAMQRARALGLIDAIKAFERPLLGVCLGQQLLFNRSSEGDVDCLGLLSGTVQKLQATDQFIVPHMGWNQLSVSRDDPLCEGVRDGDYAYFVHSYICPVTPDTIATSHYGQTFAAMVRHKNVWGCQFHPERSSATGARILANFLKVSV